MTGFHDRAERAEEIARARGGVEKVATNVFAVRSQSGDGVYLVSNKGDLWKCICPDFTGHSLPCKHILAVRLVQGGLTPSLARQEVNKRPRRSYRQNWPAYNRAQRAELKLFDSILADLVADIEDPAPPAKTGRPRLSFADLVFCAVQKVYQGLPLRTAWGFNERLEEEGRISKAPSCNMVSNLLRRADVVPVLDRLIARSALALAGVEDTFAVDSSGFRTNSFGDYCREKYGAPSHNVWIKASIIVGTKTHIIPCVTITDGHTNDCPLLPGLVEGTVSAGFVLKEVYADKGFLAVENFEAVGRAGAEPYIMFKRNSRGHRRSGGHERHGTSPLWKRMWHLFQSNPSAFLEHYHKRENAESTFASVKKKLGETIKSRDPVAQRNELRLKILSHNITILIQQTFERGIEIPGGPKPTATEPDDLPSTPADLSVDRASAAGFKLDWTGANN